LQVCNSIKHLHFLDQGHWGCLISRCHGWWNTCLKSYSQQHSLRRSRAIVCCSCLFYCWGVELIINYEKRNLWYLKSYRQCIFSTLWYNEKSW
jgi:hypothetical protein